MARALLEYETIDGAEVTRLIELSKNAVTVKATEHPLGDANGHDANGHDANGHGGQRPWHRPGQRLGPAAHRDRLTPG